MHNFKFKYFIQSFLRMKKEFPCYIIVIFPKIL